MTREERNRAISEIRNQWHLLSGFTKTIPEDWHADANFPTLLRELPSADLYKFGDMWFCQPEGMSDDEFNGTGDDPADAVTEAWLLWKAK